MYVVIGHFPLSCGAPSDKQVSLSVWVSWGKTERLTRLDTYSHAHIHTLTRTCMDEIPPKICVNRYV